MEHEVVTKHAHKYADIGRKPGDKYMADEKFIPMMRHLGWIDTDAAQVPVQLTEKKLKKPKGVGKAKVQK